MASSIYDVLIIGAGPAGATAAALLAAEGHRVGLIEQVGASAQPARTGWLNVRTIPIFRRLKIPLRPTVGRAFRQVVFFNADLSRKCLCSWRKIVGYFVDAAALQRRLIDAAAAAGAELLSSKTAAAVQLGEEAAVVELACGQSLQGRVLVGADVAGSLVAEQMPQVRPLPTVSCRQLENATPGQALGSADRLVLVLGAAGGAGLGYLFQSKPRLAIGLISRAEPPVAAEQFEDLYRQAVQAGVIQPVARPLGAAQAWTSPAGAALEIDNHVGKRCVLIGRAGGFVATISNETIYPAMWSAQLASTVISRALGSANPQDELGRFDALWRTRMAQYLRPPSTDMRYLLPLVFSNRRIAERVAAAFLSGHNI